MFLSCSTLLSMILLMTISSFKSVLSLIIFSDDAASLSPTRNLPPLICRYWQNRVSNGSLWNLHVMIKSYPSANKSYSKAWHFDFLMNREADCEVRVNFSQLGIFFIATIVVSSNIARAFGTFCLQLPGCKTFVVVSFGAFLKLPLRKHRKHHKRFSMQFPFQEH